MTPLPARQNREPPGAIKGWRAAMGPTSTAKAKRYHPGSFRARFGIDGTRNATHGSDSPVSAAREIGFFFPQILTDAALKGSEVKESLAGATVGPSAAKKSLNDVLVEGLTELCRKKPSGLDAVKWLGEWLLTNNPDAAKAAAAQNELAALAAAAAETKAQAEPPAVYNDGAAVEAPSLAQNKVVFVVGAPGSGMSTQCKMVAEEYGYSVLRVGNLMRNEVASGSDLGKGIKASMDAGELVSVETTIAVLRKGMRRNGGHKFIVRGFPRNVEQLCAYEDKVGECHSVLSFECPLGVCKQRLLKAGGRSEEDIDSYLEKYAKTFEPAVTEFYSRIGKLRTIDSSAGQVKVFQAVRKALEPTVVFVLGGPGSGRSTVCNYIQKEFGYTWIAVGELLRNEAKKGTERGNQVARMLANAQLVPTKVVLNIIRSTMAEHTSDKFVIDGFPRSTKQAAAFEDAVTVARFSLHLKAPKEVLEQRMAGRPGFKKSYALYEDQTLKVAAAFEAAGRVRDIDAEAPLHLLFKNLRSHFESKVVFALGPDGSGRNAQCKRLCADYGYTEINEVDLIQCEVMRQSKLGVLVNNMIQNHQIIPIDVKLQMMSAVMAASGNDKFVVNGFPRALDQLNAWCKAMGKPTVALYFEAVDEVCIVNLAQEGADKDASAKRISMFRSQGMPVVNELARSGLLRTVKVEPGMSTEGITDQVSRFLKPQIVTCLPGEISKAAPEVVQRHLDALATSLGYHYLDVKELEVQAKNSGTWEGIQIEQGNRSALVHAIERAAHSCGKPGVVLYGYPESEGELTDLCSKIAPPRAALVYDAPPSSDAAPVLFDSSLKVKYEELGIDLKVATVADVHSEEAELAVVSMFQPEVIIVTGCAGTGRGTLATNLAKGEGFVWVRTTKLFQAEVTKRTEIGVRLAKYIKNKQTVPLELAIPVIQAAAAKADAKTILVDGFPRIVSDGFPLAHDQLFALEESVGPVKCMLHLTADAASRASRTRSDARALAEAENIYRREKSVLTSRKYTIMKSSELEGITTKDLYFDFGLTVVADFAFDRLPIVELLRSQGKCYEIEAGEGETPETVYAAALKAIAEADRAAAAEAAATLPPDPRDVNVRVDMMLASHFLKSDDEKVVSVEEEWTKFGGGDYDTLLTKLADLDWCKPRSETSVVRDLCLVDLAWAASGAEPTDVAVPKDVFYQIFLTLTVGKSLDMDAVDAVFKHSPDTRFVGTNSGANKPLTIDFLEKTFKDLDEDGSGSLGFGEIKNAEKQFGIPSAVSGDFEMWKDGRITFAEFIGMLREAGKNILAPPPAEPCSSGTLTIPGLKEAFAEADADESGALGPDEIGVMEEKFGIPSSVTSVSGDWRDGKISFSEFLGWIVKAGHRVMIEA